MAKLGKMVFYPNAPLLFRVSWLRGIHSPLAAPAPFLHRHNPIQFWNVILEFRAAKAVHGAGDDGQLGADNALFQTRKKAADGRFFLGPAGSCLGYAQLLSFSI